MLTSDLIKPRLRMQGSTLSVEMVNEQDPSCNKSHRMSLAYFIVIETNRKQHGKRQCVRTKEQALITF